jgi:subtilisin family serine protease
MFKGLRWALDKGAQVISLSLGLDFPGYVGRLTNVGMPADLATSKGLSVFIANLRLIDNFSEGVRLRAPIDGGAILTAACGNDSKADEDPDYRITACLPSAGQGVISVGALKRTDAGLIVAPFSNTSPRLTAPGVAIKSAKVGGGLVSKSGTSMACPHVAGVAALWWEFRRHLYGHATSPQVEQSLLSSIVDDVFAPGVARADRGDGMITAP